MSAIERLFDNIPGHEQVLELLQRELSDYHFPDGSRVHGLHVLGSYDLELTARGAATNELYRRIVHPPEHWPHLIVSASQGQLSGVRSSEANSAIIEATPERAIVLIRPYTSDGVRRREASIGNLEDYEAILDFRYTQ